jgi:hypothetical protein
MVILGVGVATASDGVTERETADRGGSQAHSTERGAPAASPHLLR